MKGIYPRIRGHTYHEVARDVLERDCAAMCDCLQDHTYLKVARDGLEGDCAAMCDCLEDHTYLKVARDVLERDCAATRDCLQDHTYLKVARDGLEGDCAAMRDSLLGCVQVIGEGNTHRYSSKEHLDADDEVLVTSGNSAYTNDLDAFF